MKDLVINLSGKEASILENIAQSQNVSVEEALRHLLLQHESGGSRSEGPSSVPTEIHSEVKSFSGIVPADVDVEAEYGEQFRRGEK